MKKIFLFFLSLIWAAQLYAQVTGVSGTITDENGIPLPGVNIIEKSTTNGAITDVNGRYSIALRNPGATLVISSIGYIRQEVAAKSSVINIQLKPEMVSIEDVVVVGYGTQKKESVVGAISTASSAELRQMGTPNLSNALAGRVTGVITMVGSGRPGGDDAEIYIRGVSTLNSDNSKPLILVDGVERDYTQLDPEDIESFSVLKDASATAVYGVRGANGVLLITTKRGIIGKAAITVSFQTTLQQPTRLMTYLNSYDAALMRNEALANDGLPARFTNEDLEHFRTHDSPYTHPDNDYMKDFLRKTTPMHNVNVSVRGGNNRLRYYVSTNGLLQDGIYKQFEEAKYPSDAHFRRLNIRSNLDFEATKSTTVSLDLNSRVEEQQNISLGDITSTTLFSEMNTTPPYYYAYRLPNGSYGSNIDGQRENLLAVLNDYGFNRMLDNILEGTFKINQKLDFLTQGLSFRGMVSFNSYFSSGTKVGYRPPKYLYNSDGTYTEVIAETAPWIDKLAGNGHSKRTNMEYSLNYARTFRDHAVTAMALYTLTQSNSNADVPKGFLGYVGRVTYAFRQKYLAEFNFGYNGSDQFDKSHRYGFFPSFSLGWVASEEAFIKSKLPVISFLKIRGSYGEVGNDKIGADRFLYLQTYNINGSYFFGSDISWGAQNALYEGALGNDQVTWEVGKKSNAGFDLKLFNNKYFLNLDFFREMRVNIFTSRNTRPLVLGVDLPKENVGKVENKGLEVETGIENKIGKFGYYVRGLASFSKNTVIFQDEVDPRFEYLRRTGKPVGQNFGLRVLGYYTPDDFEQDSEGNLILQLNGKPILKSDMPQPTFGAVQLGDFKYLDRNEDGVIDSFDEGPIGNSRIPKIVYSLSYGLNFSGFDFNMMWQGSGGNHKFLSGTGAWEQIREAGRYMEIHESRWTLERYLNNEEILYPRLSSAENKHNHRNNSYYQKKGDYIRLKNFELGYTVPGNSLRKIGMSKLRFFVSGTNLLTFDYIKVMDPESDSGSGTSYPQMKLWNIGFNLQF
jgi:TonB-linked SusC/RagA family outer membrane protein